MSFFIFLFLFCENMFCIRCIPNMRLMNEIWNLHPYIYPRWYIIQNICDNKLTLINLLLLGSIWWMPNFIPFKWWKLFVRTPNKKHWSFPTHFIEGSQQSFWHSNVCVIINFLRHGSKWRVISDLKWNVSNIVLESGNKLGWIPKWETPKFVLSTQSMCLDIVYSWSPSLMFWMINHTTNMYTIIYPICHLHLHNKKGQCFLFHIPSPDKIYNIFSHECHILSYSHHSQ